MSRGRTLRKIEMLRGDCDGKAARDTEVAESKDSNTSPFATLYLALNLALTIKA